MKMTTIIKRNDGKRVQIRVRPRSRLYGETMLYEFDVMICPPGKRKFFNPVDTDSDEYRSIPINGRDAWILKKQLEHVSAAEIYQAKLEAWHQLKPTL